MKGAAGIIALALGSALTIAALVDPATGRSVVLGMAGPLAAVAVSWIVVEWTHRRDPGQVMSVLLLAFAGKAVFFGMYVLAMVKLVQVETIPFVVSFTGYFVTLYLVQAVLLQRLTRQSSANGPDS